MNGTNGIEKVYSESDVAQIEQLLKDLALVIMLFQVIDHLESKIGPMIGTFSRMRMPLQQPQMLSVTKPWMN